MSSYHSILTYLYALQSRGMKFGLRNIRLLLAELGNPHRAYPSIHVAGTNGKGSTSAFLASILQEAGYRTGLYTSPHLLRFTERIKIDGKELSTRRLVEYVEQLRPVIERENATFFEATTAVAFRYFADEGIDIAVIETGLGGRLDSTNLIRPLASVLTSIGLDHTQILGSTITRIASEKGGIIKHGRPVISSVERPSAVRVLRTIARKKQAPFYRAQSVVHAEFRNDELWFSKGMLRGRSVTPGLMGEHQKRNVESAVATISVLRESRVLKTVSDEDVLHGLERVVRNTGMRGRYDVIERRGGAMVFDVAHNPDGIRALVRLIRSRKEFPSAIVFGVMADKDYRAMLRSLRRIGRSMVVVAPHGERALDVERLAKEARKAGFRVRAADSVSRGVRMARKLGRGRRILITGSHYVVAEAMIDL